MLHPTTSAVESVRSKVDGYALTGKFPAYSMVGGYPLVYLTANDSCLCAACVNGENGSEVGRPDGIGDPDWTVKSVSPYWEGAPISCENCNEEIESAYGDPDATTYDEVQ